jgi:hypothetical protein
MVSNVGLLLALRCQALNSFTRDLQTGWPRLPSGENRMNIRGKQPQAGATSVQLGRSRRNVLSRYQGSPQIGNIIVNGLARARRRFVATMGRGSRRPFLCGTLPINPAHLQNLCVIPRRWTRPDKPIRANWLFGFSTRQPIIVVYSQSLYRTYEGSGYLGSSIASVRVKSCLRYSIGSRRNHHYHAAMCGINSSDRNGTCELEPFVARSCNPCR